MLEFGGGPDAANFGVPVQNGLNYGPFCFRRARMRCVGDA